VDKSAAVGGDTARVGTHESSHRQFEAAHASSRMTGPAGRRAPASPAPAGFWSSRGRRPGQTLFP